MAVSVSTAGELVVLAMGGAGVTMHFADALRVSALLLKHGREARRIDIGRMRSLLPVVRALGSMSDAAADKVAPSRWGRALPERYKGSEIFVRTAGKTVEIRFRTQQADLPWEAALQISQWLRVRGKEARNSINEKAKWAEIAGAE
jgi:hypothetical protein